MPPKSWGRWQNLGEPRMEGGQGEVFQVRDKTGELPGVYALKRLKNDKRLDRFESEIRITSSIDSRYVSKVYDHDIKGKDKFYVMDYYTNGSLSKYLKVNPGIWSFADKIALSVEIASGIAVLQDRQTSIIHRDLKPDNIYLTDDGKSIVIGDFGLSYDEDGERHTMHGEAVGSRFYMHPEFEDGGQIDVHPYHDFYSFGKVIYWIFSEGERFNQQKHRLPKYDLTLLERLKDDKANLGNYVMVNNLLDKLITLDANSRHHKINMIRADLVNIQRVHLHQFHPLLDEPGVHTCDFCGLGDYHEIGESANIFMPGHNMSVNPDFRKIMICGHCGHVQLFVFGLGNQKKNWFKRS